MWRTAHQGVGWLMIFTNGMAGTLCTTAHWVPSLRRRSLWWAVIAAEIVVAAQVVLGTVLLNTSKVQAPRFHMLYGFSALFAVGILYAYRQQVRQYEFLLYGLGGLFIMGCGIRALLVS